MNNRQIMLSILLFFIFSHIKSELKFIGPTSKDHDAESFKSSFDGDLLYQDDDIFSLLQELPEQKIPQQQDSFEMRNIELCTRNNMCHYDEGFNNELLLNCPEKLRYIVEELKNRDILDNDLYHTIIPHHILLVGSPGVGKSSLAKAIAESCQIAYVFIKVPLLANEYTNSGPSNLSRIFDPILKSNEPCIIIIDELQTIIKKDRNNTDTSTAEALWILLGECKTKNNIMVIATANEIDALPEQLRSRLAKSTYHIDLPSLQARERILEYYISKMPSCIQKNVTRNDIRYYAKRTSGFSIRDLEDMVEDAVSNAYFKRCNPQQRYKVFDINDFEQAYIHIKQQKKSSFLPEWCKDFKNYIVPTIVMPLSIAAVQLAVQCIISYKSHQIAYTQTEAHHQDYLALKNK